MRKIIVEISNETDHNPTAVAERRGKSKMEVASLLLSNAVRMAASFLPSAARAKKKAPRRHAVHA